MAAINTCSKACMLLLLLILATVNANTSFYDLLEVPKNADAAMIKKAFRKKSLEYHPDKNPGRSKFVQTHSVRR